MSIQLTNNKALQCKLNKLLEDEDSIHDEKLGTICSAWKERSQAVTWIGSLHQKYEFCLETLACAVQTFDRFLGVCKVQSKYLKCAALASYYIATKLFEDEKDVPSLNDLTRVGECSFGPKDLSRMENIIMGKLNWNVKTATAYSFLETLFGIFCNEHEVTISKQGSEVMSVFQELCSLLQSCIISSRFCKYKNSTLALSIISAILAKHYPNWHTCLAPLQRKTKTSIKELLHCRELVRSCSMIKRYTKTKRRPSLATAVLSPIQENPFEFEYSVVWEKEASKGFEERGVGSIGQVDTSSSPRHYHDNKDEATLPAAKRPRMGACRLMSRIDDEACSPVLTSPTKSIRI
eukprot:gene6919-7697_t